VEFPTLRSDGTRTKAGTIDERRDLYNDSMVVDDFYRYACQWAALYWMSNDYLLTLKGVGDSLNNSIKQNLTREEAEVKMKDAMNELDKEKVDLDKQMVDLKHQQAQWAEVRKVKETSK
jgi:hypothetical protein